MGIVKASISQGIKCRCFFFSGATQNTKICTRCPLVLRPKSVQGRRMSDGGVNHNHVNQGNVVCVLFWKLSISQFVLLLIFLTWCLQLILLAV